MTVASLPHPPRVRCAAVLALPLLAALTAPGSLRAEPQPLQLSADERAAMESIKAAQIMPGIRFLAGSDLEGREAGERGADIAAQYIVSRFQSAGLEAGTKEGFLQGFDLRYRVLGEDVAFELSRTEGGATLERPLTLRRDFSPLTFSEQGSVEAPLVFAGYGIEAPEWGWDDYAALGSSGARGKIVVVFRHEPDELGQASSSRFDGSEMSRHASLRQKVRVAEKHGAAGLVLIDDPLNHEVLENPGSSWRTLSAADRAKPADDDSRFRGRPDTRDSAKPLGLVAMHASQELLRWLDPDRDWKQVQRDLDAGKRPRVTFPAATARLTHESEAHYKRAANVIAVLRGSDPELSKEFVIIGGHYDHVGMDDTTKEVYNGADDNASGTTAVLAVAEALARLEKPPARSVLFALWCAEEKGLLGSDWFAHHPSVDIGKIVAGVNLDMVGRNEDKEMSVVGRTETPDLVELFDRFAPEVGFVLNDDAGAGASRSDNASLWQAGIPTASLFSGTHVDYHEPGDDASKILPGKVERAARLSFLVVNEIAQGRSTPKALVVPAGPWEPVAPPERLGGAPAASAKAAGAKKESK